MPSASVKSDSTGSSETQDPLGKVYLLIEKKIRNLEKRKNKLENYKTELHEGKKLNEDQQRAVGAFDAVIASLELCREFATQIDSVMVENTKLAKLQQKKHQEEKAHHEFERIKQVLKVQDVLTRLGQEDIRADFLAGTNGAIQIKEERLKHLKEIHKLVTPPAGPERETTTSGFKGQINTAAENMLNLLDGKNKPASSGTTYRDMRSLIYQIANCSYPKKPKITETSNTSSPLPDTESQHVPTKSKRNKGKNSIPNGTSSEETSKSTSKKNTSSAATPPSTSSVSASVLAPPSSSANTVIASSKSSSQNAPSAVSGKMKRRDVPNTEGPPPGISPAATGITNPELISAHPQVRTGLTAAASSALGHAPNAAGSALGHAPTYFNPPQGQSAPQGGSRVLVDINDLVTAGRFNFLQESQVGNDHGQQAAVYVDPAVVSFGSIKPESLVQLHEQQKQMSAQTVSPVVLTPTAAEVAQQHQQHQQQQQHHHQQQHQQQQHQQHQQQQHQQHQQQQQQHQQHQQQQQQHQQHQQQQQHQQHQQQQHQQHQQQQQQVGPIQSETFINQAFSSTAPAGGYSQAVPSYSSNAGVGGVGGGASLPAPIPMPTQQEKPPFVEPTSSWAAQEDTEGWGTPDPTPSGAPINGGEADNAWGVIDPSVESSTWGEEPEVKIPQGMSQDLGEERRGGGYRGGSSRGGGGRGGPSRGTGGGFRGGRGSYSNYQGGGRGGNPFGGNGYNSRGGGRGGASNGGGGGFRGRGNFSRGGRGNEGNSRGGARSRGGYQGNQQRNQY